MASVTQASRKSTSNSPRAALYETLVALLRFAQLVGRQDVNLGLRLHVEASPGAALPGAQYRQAYLFPRDGAFGQETAPSLDHQSGGGRFGMNALHR